MSIGVDKDAKNCYNTPLLMTVQFYNFQWRGGNMKTSKLALAFQAARKKYGFTTPTPEAEELAILVRERDIKKRAGVLSMSPKVVLVKFFGVEAIPGLVLKPRDDVAIHAKHEEEAKAAGLDPNTYRGSAPDSGLQICREHNVRCPQILGQLKAAGYRYVGGHLIEVEGKGRPVSVLQFKLEGAEQLIPTEVVEWLISYRFTQVTIWENVRTEKEDANRKYRLDTINLTQPGIPSQKKWERGTRELIMKDNSYELLMMPDRPPTITPDSAPPVTSAE